MTREQITTRRLRPLSIYPQNNYYHVFRPSDQPKISLKVYELNSTSTLILLLLGDEMRKMRGQVMYHARRNEKWYDFWCDVFLAHLNNTVMTGKSKVFVLHRI